MKTSNLRISKRTYTVGRKLSAIAKFDEWEHGESCKRQQSSKSLLVGVVCLVVCLLCTFPIVYSYTLSICFGVNQDYMYVEAGIFSREVFN